MPDPVNTWSGIRGVVLDAVGTLIDPVPSVAEVYRAAARSQGVDLEVAEIKARFYRHFDDVEADELRGPLATDEVTEHRRWRRIVAQTLPEVPDPSKAFDGLWEHFGRPENWRTFGDVPAAVLELRAAGYGLVIGSNFDARLRKVLAGFPSLADLDPVISSAVGFRKPHPGFYRAAAVRLGLPVEAILFVGDDPENDYAGPRRAGGRAALVDRDGRTPPDLDPLPSLAALVDRLRGVGVGAGGAVGR